MTEQQKEVRLLLSEDHDVDAISITRAFNELCLGNTILEQLGLHNLALLRSGAVPSPYII
ncbi:hypothetical protein H4J46_05920 [Colwellia sp. MB02u-6]|jgi:hypothetical protein|uniref:hypothetical protein n=1 Tax=Colwellia sp. MB02u-6 TaxID=2759824 RepID=UPI0015F77103|nr:hypothetical protein [Colwellia sp. MB02u-6]MBA6327480.1 hypothetical protein [Colwellia sp. MB02u-6]